MEDYRTVLRLFQPNDLMTKLDIKDAYLAVTVDKHHRKYLRFEFRHKYYEFKRLPFGLSSAPYVFTKLMKPFLCYLRNKKIRVIIYIDDILIL